MRLGLFTSMGAQSWSGVLELWRHLEATGWDIACVTDHFMPNTKDREGAMLEGELRRVVSAQTEDGSQRTKHFTGPATKSR